MKKMKIRVKFLATFREPFQGKEREVILPEGTLLHYLLHSLCDSAERQQQIFSGEALSPHVVVMKNGSPIQATGGLETELHDGDVIALFPFLGGG